MEKEEIKNVALFLDAIVAITFTAEFILEYLQYIVYEKIFLTVPYWALFLVASLSILATIFSSYYNNRTYIILSVTFSSIFIFISSILLSIKFTTMYNNPILIFVVNSVYVLYILFRAYSYLK